jgi:hypothetical protein
MKGADCSGQAGDASTGANGVSEARSEPPNPSSRGLSFVVDVTISETAT